MQAIVPYVRLARPDHWFKNVFCLPGVVLALWFVAEPLDQDGLTRIVIGLMAVCLASSSNYVINELLDAKQDRLHPRKRERPAARGQVRVGYAVLEYLILLAAALGLAALINPLFLGSAVVFCLMGLVYNIPPIRSKDLPYVDALSEALNNPLRLALGWWMVTPVMIPPLSLLVAYWMLGAYLMTLKRFAEFRYLASASVAAAYRKSFRHVNETSLLIAASIYGHAFSILLGVFFAKFRAELILTFPAFAVFLGIYLKIALRSDSPIQYPEKLYRERALMLAAIMTCVLCLVLLVFDVPGLNEWLRMPEPSTPLRPSGLIGARGT